MHREAACRQAQWLPFHTNQRPYPRWRVERFGRNRDTAGPDMDGFAPPPDRKIDPDAPDTLPVTLPVETLVAALESQVEAVQAVLEVIG